VLGLVLVGEMVEGFEGQAEAVRLHADCAVEGLVYLEMASRTSSRHTWAMREVRSRAGAVIAKRNGMARDTARRRTAISM
jgi:hypothetical protein